MRQAAKVLLMLNALETRRNMGQIQYKTESGHVDQFLNVFCPRVIVWDMVSANGGQ